MPGFAFNANIPQPNDNPSNSQGQLLTNNQSNNSIWAVDHIGFNITNSGLHQQVRMPAEALPSVQAGFGGLYCNTATAETNLFYTPDASGHAYQLTRTKDANYALFGTNTAYQDPGVPTANNPTINGGWTFLPGGLIMMYGFATPVGNTGIIAFPFTFPTAVFSASMSLVRANTGSTVQWYINAVGTNQFTYTTNNAASAVGIYFTAIGN